MEAGRESLGEETGEEEAIERIEEEIDSTSFKEERGVLFLEPLERRPKEDMSDRLVTAGEEAEDSPLSPAKEFLPPRPSGAGRTWWEAEPPRRGLEFLLWPLKPSLLLSWPLMRGFPSLLPLVYTGV